MPHYRELIIVRLINASYKESHLANRTCFMGIKWNFAKLTKEVSSSRWWIYAVRRLSRGISEWEKSESPFRQRSFLPKEFSKKSSRQTVTRERVAGSWGHGGWEWGSKGRTRAQEAWEYECIVGGLCNAKEKSSALEKPTWGTLSPETSRKRSLKFRSINVLNYERKKREILRKQSKVNFGNKLITCNKLLLTFKSIYIYIITIINYSNFIIRIIFNRMYF